MSESSSAVRSLLDIGFYLRHLAKPGDLLIVDEPELNLHPENQRRIARLLCRLVNIGIKVFITTHSDYIAKEINTLITIGDRVLFVNQLLKSGRNHYRQEEVLSYDRVKVFIAEKMTGKTGVSVKKAPNYTLTAAEIDPRFGIDARSFDSVINEMNAIQESLLFNGE